jgi:hypothetical protein
VHVKKPQAVECRSCKALMFWVITARGKKMPVDAKPDPNGGFVLTLKAEDGQLHADAYAPTESSHQRRNRYTSHFATCPNSAAHRSGG